MMAGNGQYTKGILQSLRDGSPINVKEGSFGTGGLSVVFDPLVDAQPLVTGATQYSYFDGSRAANLSNMPTGALVPGGDRWDLYGLNAAFIIPAGQAVETTQAAIRAFILSASYIVTLGQITIKEDPLWKLFGNKQYIDVFTTAGTLAAAGGYVDQTYKEPWPEETFLTLQSTVKMKFLVNCSATASAVNGLYLGFYFDRAKASQTA